MTPHLLPDLHRAAAALTPGPASHAAHQALLTLLRMGSDPYNRTHYAPGHVTVSMLLLSPNRTRVALPWHEKLQRTLQPGGHVEDADTTLLGAALRELTEETGVPEGTLTLLRDTPVDVDVHPIPARKDEPAHQHYDLRYGAQLRHPLDLPGVTWVPLQDVTDPTLRRALHVMSTL